MSLGDGLEVPLFQIWIYFMVVVCTSLGKHEEIVGGFRCGVEHPK